MFSTYQQNMKDVDVTKYQIDYTNDILTVEVLTETNFFCMTTMVLLLEKVREEA